MREIEFSSVILQIAFSILDCLHVDCVSGDTSTFIFVPFATLSLIAKYSARHGHGGLSAPWFIFFFLLYSCNIYKKKCNNLQNRTQT